MSPGPGDPELSNVLNRVCSVITAVALILWVGAAPAAVVALASAAAALMPVTAPVPLEPVGHARKRPILWVLHLSYAWLPLGFGHVGAGPMGGG